MSLKSSKKWFQKANKKLFNLHFQWVRKCLAGLNKALTRVTTDVSKNSMYCAIYISVIYKYLNIFQVLILSEVSVLWTKLIHKFKGAFTLDLFLKFEIWNLIFFQISKNFQKFFKFFSNFWKKKFDVLHIKFQNLKNFFEKFWKFVPKSLKF